MDQAAALLNELTQAMAKLNEAILTIIEMQNDPSLSAGERDRLSIELPDLQSKSTLLNARFVAVAAQLRTMAPPSDMAIGRLRAATEALSAEVTKARRVENLLSTAGELVAAAQAASAGVA